MKQLSAQKWLVWQSEWLEQELDFILILVLLTRAIVFAFTAAVAIAMFILNPAGKTRICDINDISERENTKNQVDSPA